MKYSNEKLSAFLDGELPEAEMRDIERALNDNPNLAQQIAELANVDEVLQDTFAPTLSAPIPAAVTDLLKDNDNSKSTNVIDFTEAKRLRSFWELPAAIAASLVAGFFIAQSIKPAGSGHSGLTATGPIAESSLLYAALSNQRSGVMTDAIKPILSFKSKEGHYCREFITQSSRGLACNIETGWTVISQIYAPQSSPQSGYATASSQSSEAFDDLIESLIIGDVLSPDEEKQKVELKWVKD